MTAKKPTKRRPSKDVARRPDGTRTFLPGNQAAIRHGAYARLTEVELSDTVHQLVEAIGADLPVREVDGGVPAQDAIPLRLLAETLIRRERVRETERLQGIETDDGKLRGVVEFGLRLDAQIIKLCEQMGLTPAARAKLGLDLVRTQSAGKQLEDHLRKTYGEGEVIDG